MMIYYKYILKLLLSNFTVVVTVITSVVWLTQSMRIINLIIDKGISFLDFALAAVMMLPYLIFIIIPIAVFSSVVIVLRRLLTEREIDILKSSGFSNIKIIKPFIGFAFIISTLSYVISFEILPASYSKFRDMQVHFRSNYSSLLLEEGVFKSQGNLIFYIDKKDENNNYHGIVVYDNRIEGKHKILSAEVGKIIKRNGQVLFELYNGNHQEKRGDNQIINLIFFERYVLNIITTPAAEREKSIIDVNEKSITSLFMDAINSSDGKLDNYLLASLNFRLSWPLFAFPFTILPFFFFITRTYRRKESIRIYLQISCFGIIITLCYVLCNNFSVRYFYLGSLMYIIPISISVGLYKKLKKGGYLK